MCSMFNVHVRISLCLSVDSFFFIVSIGLADFLGNINWTNLFLHWIGFTLRDISLMRDIVMHHDSLWKRKEPRQIKNNNNGKKIIKRTITEENWGQQYTWLQTSKITLNKKETNSKSKWMHTRFWNDRMQTSCNCDLTVMCNRFNDIDDIILTKPCGTHTQNPFTVLQQNKIYTHTQRKTDKIDQQIKNKKITKQKTKQLQFVCRFLFVVLLLLLVLTKCSYEFIGIGCNGHGLYVLKLPLWLTDLLPTFRESFFNTFQLNCQLVNRHIYTYKTNTVAAHRHTRTPN